MSVGGDVSINLAASMLFEAGKFGIGEIRERRQNLAVLVELAKAAQAEGTVLSDSEAERFKQWIQSTDLDALAATRSSRMTHSLSPSPLKSSESMIRRWHRMAKRLRIGKTQN
jgi:hypothetical protein